MEEEYKDCPFGECYKCGGSLKHKPGDRRYYCTVCHNSQLCANGDKAHEMEFMKRSE